MHWPQLHTPESFRWTHSHAAASLVLALAGLLTATAVAHSSPNCQLRSQSKICRGTTTTGTTGTTTTPTTTTTTTTTTGTTTTTPTPGPLTYAAATSYAAPSFTPTQTIDVYSQSAFNTAWSNLQPGQEIDVHGVTFTGEVVLANKQLSDWAEVHFDSATKFVGYSSAQAYPAVWINKDSHVRFYGGDVSDSASGGMAGAGILLYDSSYISWWGFHVHDTGGGGVFLTGINTVSSHLDFKGEVYDWGHNLGWDPHTEKGTGLQGVNIADSNYGVRDSRFAFYVHDGSVGSGFQIGGSNSVDGAWNNTIYLWCQNLTMQATSQVAGNCVQTWGANNLNNDYRFVEAENLQGRPYDANGVYSGQSLSTDTVDYGRASSTNLNPYLQRTESAISASMYWDTRHSTSFLDAAPMP